MGHSLALLLTRGGLATDSLVVPRSDNITAVLGWSPNSDAVVYVVADTLNPGLSLIVERPRRSPGAVYRDAARPAAATQIGTASISPGGLAYTSGPVEMVITALTRPDARSTRFETRRLASSTGEVNAGLSPSGDRVYLVRRFPDAGRTNVARSLVDFGGGPETPVAPIPGDWRDISWSVLGDRLVGLTINGGQGSLVEIDPATGRTRSAGTIPAGPYSDFDLTRDGRPAWVTEGALDTLRIQTGDGQMRSVPLGHDANSLRMSPFTDEILGWSWNPPLDDTLEVFHVDLTTGKSRTLVQRVWEGVDGIHWISRTTALLVMRETSYNSALYTLDVTTGAFSRLVALPFRGALFATFSNDGRRMVVRSQEPHQDVWVASIFGASEVTASRTNGSWNGHRSQGNASRAFAESAVITFPIPFSRFRPHVSHSKHRIASHPCAPGLGRRAGA